MTKTEQAAEPEPQGLFPLKSADEARDLAQQRRRQLEKNQERIAELQGEAGNLEAELAVLNSLLRHHGEQVV
jgi:flagellar motility protein MotE (MotC chaperone)